MRTVAALFVDPEGTYSRMPAVELWDEARDARLYNGPHSVVCHPPCHLWVNLAEVNYKRYGGEHNRPGNDGGCFASALASVREYGGVLEHPAGSKAWAAHGLEAPPTGYSGWHPTCFSRDSEPEFPRGYWRCEVWQSAYGHRARKRTWLCYVGNQPPAEADWSRNPGTHQCGWFDRNKPTLSKREASATPPAFAEYLIDLARNSRTKAPEE